MGVEKDVNFYNDKFEKQTGYHLHYKDSWYYVHWTQIIQMLKKINNPKILEIGCGTGQLAQYLNEEGYGDYIGFDFSGKAIEIARKLHPNKFFVGNALDESSYKHEYNTVICTEVLEHIKEDHCVIKKIKIGCQIIFSVPNFDEISHVRWFLSERQIKKRYFRLVKINNIVRIGNIYIVQGVRSNFTPNFLQRFLATRETIGLNSFQGRLKHRVKNILKIKSRR